MDANCLPHVACCQKTVIYFDRSNEIKSMEFTLNDGKKVDGFDRLKKILTMHLQIKKSLTPHGRNDEHFLLYEGNGGKFSCNTKADIDTVIGQLKKITVDSKQADENQFFQLDDILRRCLESAPLPPQPQLLDSNFDSFCPSYIVRLLLIVTRSRGQVLCEMTQVEGFFVYFFSPGQQMELERILHNPFLFVDILYLHENPNASNNVTEIYKTLSDLVDKRNGYVFESGPNLSVWQTYFAYLLAHPMLRPQFDKFRQTHKISVISKEEIVAKEESHEPPSGSNSSASQKPPASRTDTKLVDV